VVDVPPLRDRHGDAVLLANAFLQRQQGNGRRGPTSFSEDAVRAIEAHGWPGNVRELLNAVRRSAIMAEGSRISAEDLGLAVPSVPSHDAVAPVGDLDLRRAREQAERSTVVAALARANGNIVKAAELLGVSRPTLYDLMTRLAIRQHINA
jgi:two-component system NtrC family response regulator